MCKSGPTRDVVNPVPQDDHDDEGVGSCGVEKGLGVDVVRSVSRHSSRQVSSDTFVPVSGWAEGLGSSLMQNGLG